MKVAIGILVLGLVEIGLGVVIGNTILESKGLRGEFCRGVISPSFMKSIFMSTPFGMISWLGSWVVRPGLGVDRGSFVFDISNITNCSDQRCR